jgi:hypothetical protein
MAWRSPAYTLTLSWFVSQGRASLLRCTFVPSIGNSLLSSSFKPHSVGSCHDASLMPGKLDASSFRVAPRVLNCSGHCSNIGPVAWRQFPGKEVVCCGLNRNAGLLLRPNVRLNYPADKAEQLLVISLSHISPSA